MNNQNSIYSAPAKVGQRVSYYNARGRRVGIVKGWRQGMVIVSHRAGYTERVPDAALFLIE